VILSDMSRNSYFGRMRIILCHGYSTWLFPRHGSQNK